MFPFPLLCNLPSPFTSSSSTRLHLALPLRWHTAPINLLLFPHPACIPRRSWLEVLRLTPRRKTGPKGDLIHEVELHHVEVLHSVRFSCSTTFWDSENVEKGQAMRTWHHRPAGSPPPEVLGTWGGGRSGPLVEDPWPWASPLSFTIFYFVYYCSTCFLYLIYFMCFVHFFSNCVEFVIWVIHIGFSVPSLLSAYCDLQFAINFIFVKLLLINNNNNKYLNLLIWLWVVTIKI